MKNINCIIFDLGQVILNISYKNTVNSFKKLGIHNADNFYSKNHQIKIFDLLEIGAINEEEFVQEVQKICSASYIQIIEAWNSMILDLPEKRVSLIKKLKDDYKIFLLSNTNVIHINKIKRDLGSLKYADFYSLFNKVYYSYKIRTRKPEKKSFNIILDDNNLSPDEVLFIDDSEQHIRTALELGIHSYHLKETEDIIHLFSDKSLLKLH